MPEGSDNPSGGATDRRRLNRQLIHFLAFEYGVFFLAAFSIADGSVSGDWVPSIGAVFLLALVTPLAMYVAVFANKCRQEKTVHRDLAIAVILLSFILIVPLASIPAAKIASVPLEGLARTTREVVRSVGKSAGERKRERHRAELVELFSEPTAMVDARYNWVLFDNGLVGRLSTQIAWPTWLYNYLLGKELRVEVVEPDQFRRFYPFEHGPFDARRRRGYWAVPVLIYANGVSVDDVARRVLQEYATVAARLEAKHGRKIERFMQGKMYAEAESEILCGIEDLEASSVDGTYLMIGLLGDLLKVRVALGQHHLLEETMSRREALAVDFGGPESRELLGVLADHWDIYEEMGRIDEMEALRKRRKAILKNRRWHRVREFLNLLFGLGR